MAVIIHNDHNRPKGTSLGAANSRTEQVLTPRSINWDEIGFEAYSPFSAAGGAAAGVAAVKMAPRKVIEWVQSIGPAKYFGPTMVRRLSTAFAGNAAGAIIQTGFEIEENLHYVKSGERTVSEAIIDITTDVAIASVSASSSAVLGAEIGGFFGSVVPGFGTAVGIVVGAGLGLAIGVHLNLFKELIFESYAKNAATQDTV